MGELHYFCATAKKNNLPQNSAHNILINVPHDARNDSQINKSGELFKHLGKRFLIQDSGGFTVLQEANKGKRVTSNPNLPLKISKDVINIAPEHIIEAAVKLKPDIMVALDYPIAKIKDREEQRREFAKKLPYNVKWSIETSKLRDKLCPRIPLIIPVQTYTVTDFYQFIKRIHGIDFEGFSLPIRNLGLFEIAKFLLAFRKTGITRVHLLGTSYYPILCLAAYFSNNYFQWVSFDSSTWAITAKNNIYLNPLDLTRIKILDDIPKHKEKLRRSCSCPLCGKIPLAQYKHIPYKGRSYFLGVHNFYATEKVTRSLHEHVTNLVELEAFSKSNSRRKGQVEELMNFLRTADL